MEKELKILIADMDIQIAEILSIYEKVEEKNICLNKNIENEDLAISLGYQIHNLYSGYEDLFKLIAKFFENQINDSAQYHSILLKRMNIGINGIRPKVLSDETSKVLNELRGFRHVFRHSYSYELDAERVIKIANKALQIKDIFLTDIASFKESLGL